MVLSNFTNEAPSIVPALTAALDHSDASFREAITNTLKKIDRNAAVLAGAK